MAKLRNMGVIRNHRITNFYGMNTELSDIKTLPDGVTPDALNWITGTEKDMIALRRGTHLLGQTRRAAGKVTGLGIATKNDGTQIPFFSFGTSIAYYDSGTDDSYVCSGASIPTAANGDEFSINPYQNLAGAFIYVSSANSSIYKIVAANPATLIDQQSADYKGFMKFGQSRSILLNRHGSNGYTDKNGLYMSYVDKATITGYTQTTGEAVGVLGSTHYTHTLAQVSGKKTAFQIIVSATTGAGTETFQDDKNGNMVSNFGGTGTINYATGALDITFANVTTGAVTCSYYTEDATSNGVCDYSIATSGSPAVRTPGSGRYFSQFDGGGPANACFPLANVFYTFHTLKTWQTTIPTDDTDTTATNLPFREKMGVTYPYSTFGGADGIYYINNSNPNRPEVYRLSLFAGTTSANVATPELISKGLNLANFSFDHAVVFEWGIYVILSCAQIRNGVADDFNTRTFIYNKKSGVWDLTDYPVSRLAEYLGTLIAGDPLTNNIFTLFSGFDDDGGTITNYWTSGMTNHGLPGQKRCTRFVIDGLIQQSQSFDIYVSFDGGSFVKVGSVSGTSKYVDTGKTVAVGSFVLGSKTVGGGETVYANQFQAELPFNTDRYEYIRIKFVATSGGYLQINWYEYKDIRFKSQKQMPSRIASTM